MIFAGAFVLVACLCFGLLVLVRRQGRQERPPELDEALEEARERLRRPGVVIGAAAIVALALIFVLVRNPSRWAVLLLALGVLAVAVGAFVLNDRRRRGERDGV